MRRLLLLPFLILFLSLGTDTKSDKKINAGIYVVKYSQSLEQPLEVWYNVECTDGKASRKGMDFYACDSVKTSTHEDYENNEWDKGHMAPAADFSCSRETLYKTFSYLNCALQHQDLNRGVWRLLEAEERELAKKYKVSIYIKCDFTKGTKKLPTGATVPGGFRKEIKYDKKVDVYYFPNTKPTKSSFREYLVK